MSSRWLSVSGCCLRRSGLDVAGWFLLRLSPHQVLSWSTTHPHVWSVTPRLQLLCTLHQYPLLCITHHLCVTQHRHHLHCDRASFWCRHETRRYPGCFFWSSRARRCSSELRSTCVLRGTGFDQDSGGCRCVWDGIPDVLLQLQVVFSALLQYSVRRTRGLRGTGTIYTCAWCRF